MKKILFVIALSSLVYLQACTDDETVEPTNTPADTTRVGMLTSAQWQVEDGTIEPSIEIDIFGNITTISSYWDLLAALNSGEVAECDRDNYMSLAVQDSAVTLDEGATKCDAGDPQSEDGGKWNFEENETKLRFSSFPQDPTGEPRSLFIEKISSADLHLNLDYEFEDPLTKETSNHVIKLKYKNIK